MTVIYRNNDGLLSLIETALPAYWEENDQADFDLRSITWADFDNDGDMDLLIPSVFNYDEFVYYTALMRNDGPNGPNGWNFTSLDAIFAPTQHAQSSWSDFDGDQDLDLLLVNIAPLYDDGFIRRYRNDGNGNFTGEDILGTLSVEHGEAQWGDYDGDGDLDILVAGNVKELDGTYTPMALRIYRNDAETYVLTDVIDCIPCEGWFDIDNDGDLDYFIAGQYFVPGGNGLVEAQMHIYRNDVVGQNDAPSVPTGLDASMEGEGTVRFSWTASSDDHTPSVALTYDLDLFLNNIPVSIPNRLPEPGNVSAVNEWLLTGLQDGQYEWTLRAVDAAYIGSPVATGQFYVGEPTAVVPVDGSEKTFDLTQNHPNPFHQQTVIHYQIPHDGIVSLTVYDLMGTEVSVLVNEFQATGSYSITFSGENLASGIYFYSLKSRSFSETRKMLLVK